MPLASAAVTTHRHLLLFGLLSTSLALGIGISQLWPRTYITQVNAGKIRVGMTQAEVETILGGPSRDESTGPLAADMVEDKVDALCLKDLGLDSVWLFRVQGYSMHGAFVTQTKVWISDRAMVRIQQDREGRALHVDSIRVCRAPMNPLETLRRLFRL